MQLYFIRHAQSENNLLWDTNGSGDGRSEDPGLTSAGVNQIKFLADYLSQNGQIPNRIPRKDYHNRYGFNFTHLYTSPMVRAVETGYAVSKKINIPLTLWVDLHESGGVYLDTVDGKTIDLAGKNKSYFREKFPGIIMDPLITNKGWWNKPFEESSDRSDRAKRVISKLLNNHSADDVIGLFSHGSFFNYFLAALSNQKKSDSTWVELNNVGITRIDLNNEYEKINIVYVNKADFLPDELIT
jgi:2,3-bisphosphoglycerate-dependent phosphoglycerate mutase